MDTISSFWQQRLIEHGHTGWADPVIYAFDQVERLALIKAAVIQEDRKFETALDFGCGTGDFSRMLLQMGLTVCGYDPFVKPAIASRKFSYADEITEISIASSTADLALSVTALDHILDEKLLFQALTAIRCSLSSSGVFYMLEYALDSENDRSKFNAGNGYQSFRTLNQWKAALLLVGLRMTEVIPAPHPILNPSDGYLAYTRSTLVRIRRRYNRIPLARYWFDPMLGILASRLSQTYPVDLRSSPKSPLKFIRCLPITPHSK